MLRRWCPLTCEVKVRRRQEAGSGVRPHVQHQVHRPGSKVEQQLGPAVTPSTDIVHACTCWWERNAAAPCRTLRWRLCLPASSPTCADHTKPGAFTCTSMSTMPFGALAAEREDGRYHVPLYNATSETVSLQTPPESAAQGLTMKAPLGPPPGNRTAASQVSTALAAAARSWSWNMTSVYCRVRLQKV